MLVRFGFVAMSMQVKNASPSKTMTASAFEKIADREAALRKLVRLAQENLQNTKRLLYHCIGHDIRFYRFSSRLLPLAGHDYIEGLDYFSLLKDDFYQVGEVVRKHQIRTGFHPDHFTVLNSPRCDVVASSIASLDRHVKMLEAMELDQSHKCNIHIGGSYNNKEKAGRNFINQFSLLDRRLQSYLCLENDDKTFTVAETLAIAEEVGAPFVLDIHHHRCNHEGDLLTDYWPRIVTTWKDEPFPPKVHLSSPRSESQMRAHADYVHLDDAVELLRGAAEVTDRLDVMIEAKRKDEALFRLIKELASHPAVTVMDQASIRWKES
ncbi:UV DNA damage repair endonuclease UvsE [Mechercharimyces sp. CAU 1602]|uniref:UV DNA damage repair endonuclease UvsE n=1 Tax=Mechercharimyces sp. CAU 1602 TaxID=2973933 RepID=UPI0021617979|nr:UV DNA damage repair endonuclease UvsE [Mechercharimyces sp. CAU 1602]MCS1352029.1 UV DNA damage repair endonuclease UvsE [Mechercharimyces sp. CAU 1602]